MQPIFSKQCNCHMQDKIIKQNPLVTRKTSIVRRLSIVNTSTDNVTTQSGTKKIIYPTVEDLVGETPVVRLQRLPGKTSNTILVKLEGNNPAGSVKDRPAMCMLQEAELAGKIKKGDTILEATSGNTGIALAMAASIKGYKMKLLMPSSATEERKAAMTAYGAELISVDGGMEDARVQAEEMEARGEGVLLNQYCNPDNSLAHYRGTGPEIWRQTSGTVTHFISAMGSTGTIMGTQKYLKKMNPDIQIVGLEPRDGAAIAGIRKWPEEYVPTIFSKDDVDQVLDISQREADETMRALARTEGIFAGVSSGGAVSAALRLSQQVENATIVTIVCDRGDRYLSTGIYSEKVASQDPQPCDVSNFESSLARFIAYPAPHYILFSASEDEETGKSWNDECNRCNSIIRQQVEQTGGTLLQINVGSKEEWESEDHQFRNNNSDRINIESLPTLVAWDCQQFGTRMDEELIVTKDADKLQQAVGAFIRGTNSYV